MNIQNIVEIMKKKWYLYKLEKDINILNSRFKNQFPDDYIYFLTQPLCTKSA